VQDVIGAPPASSSPGFGVRAALLLLAGLVGIGAAFLGPLAAVPIVGVLVLVIIIARPEYGIALFLSTFLMAYPKALQGSGYLTINNVLGGVFGAMVIYELYRDGDWWFLRTREVQLLFFVVVMYFLSERINGPDPLQLKLLGPGFYFAEGLRTFTNRVAFTLFFIIYIRKPSHLRMIYVLAIAFMVITALTGVQGVLLGGGLKGYRASTEVTDLVSGQVGLIRSAGNPNRLAMFAILGIAGLWYLTQSLRSTLAHYGALAAMALLSLAVFMTASRSGLLGLLVCVAAILIGGGFSLRRILSFGLAGLLLSVLVIRFVPEKSLERITNLPGTSGAQAGEGSASIERREFVFQIATEMLPDNPLLGVGMGNWAATRFINDPGYSIGSPHNSYILALVEGGPLCLGAFVALLWLTWRNLSRCELYVDAPGSPLGEIAWVVKSAKVSLLVLIFFSAVADLWQLVIIFMLVGISVVARRLIIETERRLAFAR